MFVYLGNNKKIITVPNNWWVIKDKSTHIKKGDMALNLDTAKFVPMEPNEIGLVVGVLACVIREGEAPEGYTFEPVMVKRFVDIIGE